MIRKPILVIGSAAVFAVSAGVVQAQTNTQTTPSTPMPPSQSQSLPEIPSQSQSAGSNATKSPQAKSPSKANKRFVMEAIQGDMAEVKMGQLAQEKGESQAVKQFGETLVNDHGAHQQKA